jgi:diguanylate cyclase (GGDEF)-like protein
LNLIQNTDFELLKVSASIGAVAYATPAEKLQDMIKVADEHMYAVKASGKNRVHVKTAQCET